MRWSKHVNYFLLVLHCIVAVSFSATVKAQDHSVLSTGVWYKFGITESGIYKIDLSLLRKLGVKDFESNPKGIRIFGNGGGMLPQSNQTERPKDLLENAIWIDGESDGRFDSSDAIYFFAEGPNKVLADPKSKTLQHETNLYSDTTFYFLTKGSVPGKRLAVVTQEPATSTNIIESFDDYWYHDKDSYNILRSGRQWWGEYLGTTALSFPTTITNIIPSSPILLTGSAIASSPNKSWFNWLINGKTVGTDTVGTVTSGTYTLRALLSEETFSSLWDKSTSPPTVGLVYNRNGQNSALAYLNFIGIQAKRQLQPSDNQQIYYFFSNPEKTARYRFQNVKPEWQLWDISDPTNAGLLIKSSTGQVDLNLASPNSSSRFIGFTPTQAKSPASSQLTANQDINLDINVDLLIVTAPAYKAQANRLADFRRTNDHLKVKVVTTNDIYNQYASGQADITAIRDYTKYIYDKSAKQLKYLLLFGDATYDYKNIYHNQTLAQRTGWVPVYESRESLHPVYTFSSDDYFGFLNDKDGDWVESTNGDQKLSIGIGRLPVKSAAEAKTVVDKLIHYASSNGEWKNEIRFVADDGDGNIHQMHADSLARMIGKDFFSTRIFVDEYSQTETNLGQKAPAVNNMILKSINKGSLIINYTGHGGTTGWSQEQILTLSDMINARGYDNLPVLVTATCDFGRYDDMSVISGGELMVLSPRGGAVASFSTTRPVYSSTNFTLNKAFYESIKNNTENQRLGDIIRVTKNNSLVGSLNRNFTLIGDPTLHLISKQQYISWAGKPDTLSALGKASLRGRIFNVSDSLQKKDFNGIGTITVYDKVTEFHTLGDEDEPQSYSEFRNKLFEGTVSVVNGDFVCQFIVPKGVDKSFGVGRVNIYARDSTSGNSVSQQLDIVVGGEPESDFDSTPPVIQAYMNDSLFRDGGIILPASDLIVRLSDESGINLSTEKGYGITAILNDTLEINLTDYYSADIDDFTKGTVYYPFENLPVGKYSMTIKVWDNYNNSSKLTFGFQVETNPGIQIESFTLYPNPFKNDYSFTLTHSRSNEDVEITFKILSLSGQILGSEHWIYYNSDNKIEETITSNPLTKNLNHLTNYLYNLEIRSLRDNSTTRKTGRLFRIP